MCNTQTQTGKLLSLPQTLIFPPLPLWKSLSLNCWHIDTHYLCPWPSIHFLRKWEKHNRVPEAVSLSLSLANPYPFIPDCNPASQFLIHLTPKTNLNWSELEFWIKSESPAGLFCLCVDVIFLYTCELIHLLKTKYRPTIKNGEGLHSGV